MSMPLPDLDDLRFDSLLDEARQLLPALAPSWTDHNPSDPGITLIELFAFLAEMLVYRVSRVTEANKRAFVALLRNPDYVQTLPVDEEIRQAIQALAQEERAVTGLDFEERALAVPGVVRARCLPRCDLSKTRDFTDAPAHVSLVIVPADASPDTPTSALTPLIERVTRSLQRACLLTTRLHVVGPRYLPVQIQVRVHIQIDRDENRMRPQLVQRLSTLLAPTAASTASAPWPFGRALYLCDVFACLDAEPGVDHVEAISDTGQTLPVLSTTVAGRAIQEDGQFTGLKLAPDELIWLASVRIDIRRATIPTVSP